MSIHVPVLQVDLCNHCRRNMAEHDYDYESLSGLFTNTSSNSCFNYERCTYQYVRKNTKIMYNHRYVVYIIYGKDYGKLCLHSKAVHHEFLQRPCENTSLHSDYRYSDSSAAWVLIASIIVFFMVRFKYLY